MKQRLAIELVLDGDGHLTEVGAAALADGQDALLPEGAAAHVEQCEACAAAVGEQALRSADAHLALAEARPAPQRAPWWAVVAAAALAVLGLVPSAGEAQREGLALLRVGPPAAMAVRSALRGPEFEAMAARTRLASAAVLGATALALAALQIRSRQQKDEGEIG